MTQRILQPPSAKLTQGWLPLLWKPLAPCVETQQFLCSGRMCFQGLLLYSGCSPQFFCSILPTAWVAQLGLRLWALWQPSALRDQRPTDLELGQILAQAHVFLPKLFQWRSRFPSYCRLLKRQTNKFSTICQCRSPATSWHCLWILASSSNPTSASQNKRHNSKREGKKIR